MNNGDATVNIVVSDKVRCLWLLYVEVLTLSQYLTALVNHLKGTKVNGKHKHVRSPPLDLGDTQALSGAEDTPGSEVAIADWFKKLNCARSLCQACGPDIHCLVTSGVNGGVHVPLSLTLLRSWAKSLVCMYLSI